MVIGFNGSGKSNVVEVICWVIYGVWVCDLCVGCGFELIFYGLGGKVLLGFVEV